MPKKITNDYFKREIGLDKKTFKEYIGLQDNEKVGSFHLERKAQKWRDNYTYSVKSGDKTAPKICTVLCKLYEDVRRGDVDFDIIEKEFVIVMGMAKKMSSKLDEYWRKNK
jgi:hypothetical protein